MGEQPVPKQLRHTLQFINLGSAGFFKVSYSHQGCIYLIKNTVNSNIVNVM